MPRVCTICSRPDRAEVDAAIVTGEPNRRIATRVGTSEAAIRRHGAAHVPLALANAKVERDAELAEDLMELLGEVREGLRDAIAGAKEGGDHRARIAGLKTLLDVADLAQRRVEILAQRRAAELAGRCATCGGTVDVMEFPEVVQLRADLLNAARAHPEVREVLSAVLLGSSPSPRPALGGAVRPWPAPPRLPAKGEGSFR